MGAILYRYSFISIFTSVTFFFITFSKSIAMETQKMNKEFLVILEKSPTKLDPYSYSFLSEWYVHVNITSTLVRVTPDNQLKPGLAKRWSISEDKKTIRFFLRTDMFWSDGTAITPEEIANSIMIQPKHKSADYIKKILQTGSIRNSVYIERGNELVIKLKYPVKRLMYNLARPEFGLVKWQFLESNTNYLVPNTPTSGDYSISTLNEKELVLVPNKFSNELAETNPQIVRFVWSNSNEAVMRLIRSGELDFFEVRSNEILDIAKKSGFYNIVAGGFDNFATMQTRTKLSDKLEAIQILAKYIRREEFLAVDRKLSKSFIVDSYDLDIMKGFGISKENAIAQLGNKKPRILMSLSMEAASGFRDVAQKIQQQASEIGIDVNIKVEPNFSERWTTEDYELSIFNMPVYNDNEAELIHGYLCTGFAPYQSISTLVCLELEEYLSSINQSEAKEKSILKKSYLNIINSGYITPLFHFQKAYLVHKEWNTSFDQIIFPYPIFNSYHKN